MQEVQELIKERYSSIPFAQKDVAPEIWEIIFKNTTYELPRPSVRNQTQDSQLGFQVAHPRWGHVSIKPGNIRINLTKLITSVGTSLKELKELSGVLSVLFTVAKSTVIILDDDEAAIIHAIHLHKISLPKDSISLYKVIEPMVSKYVTFDRYMDKLTVLAYYGIISIDQDQVKITEGYLRLE